MGNTPFPHRSSYVHEILKSCLEEPRNGREGSGPLTGPILTNRTSFHSSRHGESVSALAHKDIYRYIYIHIVLVGNARAGIAQPLLGFPLAFWSSMATFPGPHPPGLGGGGGAGEMVIFT